MFVYLVTNKVNGKKYVGQHSGLDLQKYWKKHAYRALASPTDRVRAIYSAIRKYGLENFEIKPLVIVGTKEDLNYYEIELIRVLKTKAPSGYNLTDGGDGVSNPSQETRQKMSESQTGKTQSEETKLKRSQSLRGQKRSEETKRRMSEAQMGNKNCLGRVESEETRQKKSKAHLGNKYALGAVRSPEYLKALSERFKGRKFTPEHRRKLSEAAKNRRKAIQIQ